MRKIIMIPQETSEDLDEGQTSRLMDLTLNGIEIETTNDENPMAWDAGIHIKDGKFLIEGSFAPGGFGKVSIELPITAVEDNYTISCEVYEEDSQEVVEILGSAKWLFKII